MRRPWDEVRCLAHALGTYNTPLPVFIAGDIFDRYNPPPELINLALTMLPSRCFGIPGQHDLPFHNYGDIRKSGYWTLVCGRMITDLNPNKPLEIIGHRPLRIHAFPWGYEIKRWKEPHDLIMEVAIVHSYIYTKLTGHPDAAEDRHISGYSKSLSGYDVAVFGDNHKPFMKKIGNCLVYNSGGFYRRTSDERDHKPSVGILYSDGTIKRHYLNISKDKCLNELDADVLNEVNPDIEEFINKLQRLSDSPIHFESAVRRYLDENKIPKKVKRIVLAALELTDNGK